MRSGFEVKCEWGEEGILHLRSWAEVIIIVDVFSFSTCIDVIMSCGSIVYPYWFKDESVEVFAQQKNAHIAVARGKSGFTLSPESLIQFPKDSALVLPSPNGATLSLLPIDSIVMSGCLRNASSVAKAAMKAGRKIAVIPAGERWNNNKLRVSYEDLVGAGAIISAINGIKSSEASFASLAFKHSSDHNFKDLSECVSSLELIEHGYPNDVRIALQYDVSYMVPCLQEQCYRNSELISA